jgi:hypothetical protein
MQTIQVEIRNVYGVKTVYPVCDTAKRLATLSGNKTLTSSAIITIKQLGYKIDIVHPMEVL